MPLDIPPGFKLIPTIGNHFVEANGPLYGRRDADRLVLGIRVEERHCNPGSACHGGMLALLGDLLLIIGSNVQAKLSRYLLTVSLNCDFIAPAPLGSWLEGRCEVLKVTRALVFAQGLLTVEGQPVMRTNGTFRIPPEPDPRYHPDRYDL
jgi:uncharacterized protein (TIGR00369 family)